MNTQCMQTGLGHRGDRVMAAGPGQVGGGSWLKSLFAAAAVSVSRLTAGFARARDRRAALRELSSLSDRQLTDIGLNRAQLGEVVDTMLRAAGRRTDRAHG
jgi:uncharacterized protein YjiS (DUF1127 family)